MKKNTIASRLPKIQPIIIARILKIKQNFDKDQN